VLSGPHQAVSRVSDARVDNREPHHVLLMGLDRNVWMYTSEAFMSIAVLLRTGFTKTAHAHMILFDDDV
jgi:hypothetical protein